MAQKAHVSMSDFQQGGFMGSGGTCQVLDANPTRDFEDWRSPNRILEVTIHRVCYPITEELLYQVFGPFGDVEQVHVFGGSVHVLAQVVFQSRNDAVEAFGELHGRNIYDGCCQLDIKWGSSQANAKSDVSCYGTTENSSSTITMEHVPASTLAVEAAMTDDVVPGCIGVQLPTTCSMTSLVGTSVNHLVAVFPVMEAVSADLNSNELALEAATTGENTDILAIAAAHDGIDIPVQSISILDVMDCSIADKVQLPAVSMVAKDAVLAPNLPVPIWNPHGCKCAI